MIDITLGEIKRKMTLPEGKSYIDIKNYYIKRNLKWPTTEEAMMWVMTEIAEVYEYLLALRGGWVRNNPEDHPDDDTSLEEIIAGIEEELGDVILMLLVTGMTKNVDPLAAIQRKLGKWLG